MADLTAQVLQSALASSNEAPDISGAMKTGAELAHTAEQIQASRMEIEWKKQQLQQTKLQKFVEAVDKGKDFKDPSAKKNYYEKFLPNYRDQLGLTQTFPDEALKFVTGNDENLGRARTLTNWVRQGKMTPDQAIAAFNDPLHLADVPVTASTFGGKEDEIPDLAKVIHQNKEDENRIKVAEITQAGQNTRQENTPNIQLREKINTDWTNFNDKGGLAKAQANLKKLDAAIKLMEEGKVKTGPGAALTGVAGGAVQGAINPKLKYVKDSAKGVIDIKGILDSQFSDRAMEETQRTLGIDDSLPTDMNLQKMKDLRDQMGNALNTKLEMFRRNGNYTPGKVTPKGPGRVPQAAAPSSAPPPEFKPTEAQISTFKELSATSQEKVLQSLSKRFKITVDEVKAKYGVK